MQPLVIVGSGLAAYMLAREWRKQDNTTPLTMLTRSQGHYYSKPQLSTALTKEQTAKTLVLKSVEAMREQLEADIMTDTTVTAIDLAQQTVSFSGQRLRYSRLVLATGASPVVLPLKGNAADACVAVNNLEDYAIFQEWLQQKQHLAILGAGLVGCELMNDLLNTGHRPTMIALDQAPLARFIPPVLGEVFQRVLSEKGVRWNLGVSVKTVDRHEQGYAVGLSNGDRVQADGVLSAVGLRACTQLARQSGLTVDRGIVVDRTLRTNVPNVYALGDCAQVNGLVLQYVAPLLQSARALAKTLAGTITEVQYPPMPVIIKTPSCPVVTLPPAAGEEGRWQIEGGGQDWCAQYLNDKHELKGFSLMGACVKERSAFVKKMQPVWV